MIEYGGFRKTYGGELLPLLSDFGFLAPFDVQQTLFGLFFIHPKFVFVGQRAIPIASATMPSIISPVIPASFLRARTILSGLFNRGTGFGLRSGRLFCGRFVCNRLGRLSLVFDRVSRVFFFFLFLRLQSGQFLSCYRRRGQIISVFGQALTPPFG
jgi:hypothetical protein